MKFAAEWIMEYVLLSAVCVSWLCFSEWNSCERSVCLCVLGIVSGTARIACGCLAGLIPLNSTISFHSLSTKTCPPAKVHFHCFLPSLFQEKTKLRGEAARYWVFVRLHRATVSAKLALSCSVHLFSLWRVSCCGPNYCCCCCCTAFFFFFLPK